VFSYTANLFANKHPVRNSNARASLALLIQENLRLSFYRFPIISDHLHSALFELERQQRTTLLEALPGLPRMQRIQDLAKE
jgi:hypothetical protein